MFTLRFRAGQTAAPLPQPAPSQALSPCRILVIEDDQQIQDFLRLALPECEVEIAGEGEAGLALFREGRQDVILVDLSMPGMNGVTVARKIREIDPEAPVVLMTGWSDLPEGTEDLFRSFLPKPFTVQALKQCLSEILVE